MIQAPLAHKVQQVQLEPLAQRGHKVLMARKVIQVQQVHKVQQVKVAPLARQAHKAQQVQQAP